MHALKGGEKGQEEGEQVPAEPGDRESKAKKKTSKEQAARKSAGAKRQRRVE